MAETGDERRNLYRRWLKFTENLGTWAYEPDAPSPAEHQRQLHDLMAEIDLLASSPVRAAVQDYIDHLPQALDALQSARSGGDLDSERNAVGIAFGSAMRPYRDAMVAAMRDDIEGP